MQVEDLADDLPLVAELHEVHEIGEAVPGPVIHVDTHIGAAADDVDLGQTWLDAPGRPVLVAPVEETPDRTAEKVFPHGTAVFRGE